MTQAIKQAGSHPGGSSPRWPGNAAKTLQGKIVAQCARPRQMDEVCIAAAQLQAAVPPAFIGEMALLWLMRGHSLQFK
eukprot:CAMPEP_0172830232 /NCGR_PEP_ID=MMETSP1075-20121228/22104_1 /TAXON_ID=2916 /ORGANISM="Ceratium fusus, Strain PA161109" /LENGTH=77 /DNA_ID=CAMNT_0013672499 /DNA_START=11 /DNA_END=245 /DNA_ORIENTATION=-